MFKGTGWTVSIAGCLSAAAFMTSAPGFADTISFSSTPASTAISRVDQAFNTNIYVTPGLLANRNVSFNIFDTSDLGGRVSAISYLAHQLDANKQTVLIVEKSNGNAWKAPEALDTKAVVTFSSRTLPASNVLTQIAYVDDAALRYATPLQGAVTLSALNLPATQALAEVAAQTHCTVTVAYRLISRDQPYADLAGSTIVGYRANGQPITAGETVSSVIEPNSAPHHSHRSRRYAHRNKSGSISIVTTGSGNEPGPVPPSGPVTVYDPSPSYVPRGPVIAEPMPLPGEAPVYPEYAYPAYPSYPTYPAYPYGPAYGYPMPYAWNAPYGVGNNVVIVPSGAAPTIVP